MSSYLANESVTYEKLSVDLRRFFRNNNEVPVESTPDVTNQIMEIAICVICTDSDITLSGEQTLQSVDVIANDFVCVNGQADKKQNGVYLCKDSTWERWSDGRVGHFAKILGGTYANRIFHNINNELIYGETEIEFELLPFNISELFDVSLSSLITNDILKYDGTNWVNTPIPTGVDNLSDLADVNLDTLATNDVLTWNGSEWVNEQIELGNSNVGITLNSDYVCGFKHFIDIDEHVKVPIEYEYNGFNLEIDGILEVDGIVNIIHDGAGDGDNQTLSLTGLHLAISGGNSVLLPSQIQADWNQTDDGQLDYIKNKPSIPTVENLCCTTVYNVTKDDTDVNHIITKQVQNEYSIIHSDCHFHTAKITFQINANPLSNNEGYDFVANGIYLIILKDVGAGWVKIGSELFTAGPESTIYGEYEFLIADTQNCKIGYSLSRTDDIDSTEIISILNFEDFSYSLLVTKCPKSAYFGRHTVPGVAPGGVSALVYETNPLPFAGFYEVDVFITGITETDMTLIPENLGSAQSLEIWDESISGYSAIGLSHTFSPGISEAGNVLSNSHLQGSAIIKLQSDKKIKIRTTLPNGALVGHTGGYIHAKYTTKEIKPSIHFEI